MGTCQPTHQRSHSTCEDDACNCFYNDPAIQHRQIVSLTKDHSFSVDHDDIPTPTMHHAKFYPKNTDLSNKPLCSTWHKYFFKHSPSQCLSIALIDTTSDSDLSSMKYMADHVCILIETTELHMQRTSNTWLFHRKPSLSSSITMG
eukprot:530079_1